MSFLLQPGSVLMDSADARKHNREAQYLGRLKELPHSMPLIGFCNACR
jgi:hypothetical protein